MLALLHTACNQRLVSATVDVEEQHAPELVARRAHAPGRVQTQAADLAVRVVERLHRLCNLRRLDWGGLTVVGRWRRGLAAPQETGGEIKGRRGQLRHHLGRACVAALVAGGIQRQRGMGAPDEQLVVGGAEKVSALGLRVDAAAHDIAHRALSTQLPLGVMDVTALAAVACGRRRRHPARTDTTLQQGDKGRAVDAHDDALVADDEEILRAVRGAKPAQFESTHRRAVHALGHHCRPVAVHQADQPGLAADEQGHKDAGLRKLAGSRGPGGCHAIEFEPLDGRDLVVVVIRVHLLVVAEEGVPVAHVGQVHIDFDRVHPLPRHGPPAGHRRHTSSGRCRTQQQRGSSSHQQAAAPRHVSAHARGPVRVGAHNREQCVQAAQRRVPIEMGDCSQDADSMLSSAPKSMPSRLDTLPTRSCLSSTSASSLRAAMA